MNMFHQFFGRAGASQSAKRTIKKSTRGRLSLEPLEERHMLSIGGAVLASVEGNLNAADETAEVALNVKTQTDKVNAAIGITVESTSTLDPAAIKILNSEGKEISAGSYVLSEDGDSKSTIIVNLPKGDYKIQVKGDDGTYGSFTCDVFLPGVAQPDEEGGNAATVDKLDQLKAQTASSQGSGNWNENTLQYYKSIGKQLGYTTLQYNPSNNMYNSAYDVNSDGVISATESAMVATNAGAGTIEVSLNASETITITAKVTKPVTSDANTTRELAIDGTVSGSVSAFTALFTSAPSGVTIGTTKATDILSKLSSGKFTLDSETLLKIFGTTESTLPDGKYKIKFEATGSGENASTASFEYEFTLYTKQSQPVAKDLDAGTLYPIGSESKIEIDIEDLVEDEDTIDSHALVSVKDANGTTHTIKHDEAVEIKDADGKVLGSLTYTGGTKGAGDVYYGGKVVITPTAAQIALSKGAADIAASVEFIVQDDSGTETAKSDEDEPGTLSWKVTPVNKTPVVDLEDVQTQYVAGDEAFEIKLSDIADDANTADTISFGAISVTVGGTVVQPTVSDKITTWTTPEGTVITFNSETQIIAVTPADEDADTEEISIAFTVKDDAGVSADNTTTGEQKSETATQTLVLKVASKSAAPSVTVKDIALTQAEAEAGNIATGWTVSYAGDKTLTYKIGKEDSELTTIPANGTATQVPGLGTFTLTSAGVLTWTVVDESLYKDITGTQTVKISYSAATEEGTSLKTATVTVTAASQNAFADQDLYISPNLTPDTEGDVSSTGALVVQKSDDTTVAYTIESVKGPDGADFDKTKFSIDENGKIVIAAEDLDEFAIGSYTIVVKATFTTDGSTEDITADVTLKVEQGIPTLADGTVNIAEKATADEAATGTGTVTGLGENETWHLVDDSLELNATINVSAHGNVEAYTKTLSTEELTAILALASVSRDTATGNLVFTFTPNAAYREYFQFLSEAQQATLTFTCEIEGDRYGQTAEGTYTLIVTGQNDQPVLESITGATNVDTAINVSIADLIEQGKIDDHDLADQFSFYRVAGTEIDAAFLEGNRTITLESGATITVAADGKSFTYTPSASSNFASMREGVTGTDTFKLSIKDDSGIITNAASEEKDVTFTITGTNKAPVATTDSPAVSATEGVNVTIEVGTEGVYATDPNTGDTLSFHSITSENAVSVNGAPVEGDSGMIIVGATDQVMVLASGATVTLKPDGTILYVPGKVANGTTFTEELTYKVIDDAPTTPLPSENSGTLKIAVAGIPHAPELIDPEDSTSTVTIDETDHTTVIDLGDKWTDFDGDAFAPVFEGTPTFEFTGVDDADKAILEAMIASGKGGTFTVGTDGKVTFAFTQDVYKQLGKDQSVTVTLTYKMQETGTGALVSEDVGTITVTIEGVNDPPQRLRDPLDQGKITSDSSTGVTVTLEEILSTSNWSDPDFNDNPMSGHYDVTINVVGFNGQQLGMMVYDEDAKSWTYKPNGDLDYLKEGEIEHVYIEYVITSLRNEDHSAAGWLLIDVEGVFFPVTAEDQDFKYSTEQDSEEGTYVGTIAFTQHLAERYGFEIDPDSIVAYDAEGNVLTLTEAAVWTVDDNGNLYVTTTGDTDWTDVKYYEFELLIANKDSERPEDFVEITIHVDITDVGTSLTVTDKTLEGTEGGATLEADLKDQIEEEGAEATFDSLKLVTTGLEDNGNITESMFNKLSAMNYVELDADGNIVFTPDGVTFSFVPGGDKLELVFQYVVTDNATGLKSLATLKVYVTGINNAPTAYDYEHKTAVDADSTEGITVSINDLMEVKKVVDPDFNDVVSFDTIAGTTIDAAFLAGNREIVLPSGSKIVVAANGLSFVYFPNTSETDNPFYTLRHGAILKDAFSYSVVDKDGEKSNSEEDETFPSITMQVKGVNKTPTQKDDAEIPANKKTVVETGSITISASDLAQDVNIGDSLSFGSVSFGGEELTQGGPGVKNEHGSTLTWNADGTLTLDASTRNGNVGQDMSDADVITFTVIDDSGATNAESAEWTHTVSVTGLNDAPVGKDHTMQDGDAVQVGQSGQTTMNVPFSDFFTDADVYTTPDTHKVYINNGTEYVLVTAEGVTLSSMACTVKLGTDGKSLDFVFTVSEGNLYDKLREGQIAPVSFDFYVVDQHEAASGSDAEGEHNTITLKLKGVNKQPVVKDSATSQTVEVTKTFTFNASDLVNDRNVGDTHTFVQINGEDLPPIGTEITLYDNDDSTVEIGKLKVVSASELLFTPNPELVEELVDDMSVASSFTFIIADDSGATNAQTAEATMTITVVPESIQSREFVGSILDTGSTVLDLNQYFSGSNLTFVLAGIDYGYDAEGAYNGTNPYFKGFLEQGNVEAIAALVNQEIDGGTINLNFLGAEDYHRSLDFTPITLNLKVYDENGDELVDQSGDFMIRLEEQFTVKVVAEPSSTARSASIYDYEGPCFVDVLPDVPEWTVNNPYQVEVGSRYYIHYWVQDLANTIFGATTSTGIVESLFTVPFDQEIANVVRSSIAAEFGLNPSEIVLPTPENGLTEAYIDKAGTLVSLNSEIAAGFALYDQALIVSQVLVVATGVGNPGLQIDKSSFESNSIVRYDDFVENDGVLQIHPSQIQFQDAYIEHIEVGGDSNLMALSRETVEEDGGIYMRTVESPTQTGEGGIVSELPIDTNMLHEWQSHYVELWVKASEADKYSYAMTDLAYNSEYFTATSVELGEKFRIGNGATIDDANGLVSGIGGYAQYFEEVDGYILLGRVKFESIGSDNVAWGDTLTPHSLGLELSNGGVRSTSGEWISKLGEGSKTELWANPYDVNDDQSISIVDFSQFIKAYGQRGTDGMALISGFDFDNNGSVNIADFSRFIKSYGVTREMVASGKKMLVLPETYTQRYIGMQLDADNLDNVGTLLDAANQAWADALGLDKPVEIQLVVKDYKDSTTLGEAVLLEVDENGIPSKGMITLDNDAAGLGWYSQITDPVNESNYDLYTTLLHELGHIYGINTAYNAFNSVKFQYGDLIDSTGHVTVEDDVMYAGINTGERKYITELDVNIISTAYGAAYGNNKLHGFTTTPAKLEAYGEKTIEADVPEAVLETVSEVVAEFEETEVFQSDARLVVPVASEATAPMILETQDNARSLAELNTLGLDIALPQVQATGSMIESVDFVVEELFPSDESDEEDEDYAWVATAPQNASSDLLGELLSELV